jgi:cobalt-zinc-cadmium resistance protein CzcA
VLVSLHFRIAVLNGQYERTFEELKHQGMKDIDALILKGTTDRLRPVLLTSSAALGFYLWQFHLRKQEK